MGPEALIGKACTRVFEHYPQNFSFEFDSGFFLRVDCLWRVIIEGRLALTSRDHGEKFGLASPVDVFSRALVLLNGHRVSAIRQREDTEDLILDFEGNICLEVLTDSSGYEPWDLDVTIPSSSDQGTA